MSWSVMSDIPNPLFDVNGDPYSGAVLKAYLPGTTTSTSIAIAAAGTSPQTSITANAEGKWEVSGNEILPYINKTHKWGIFANATDATANTPFYMGPFNGVEQSAITGGTVKQFATLALAVSDTALNDGDAVDLEEVISGNLGPATGDVVLSSTVTEDTYTIIQCTGVATLSIVLRRGDGDVRKFGAIADGSTDSTLPLNAAKTYLAIAGMLPRMNGAFVSDTTSNTLYNGVATITTTSAAANNNFMSVGTGDNAKDNRKMACVLRNSFNASQATVTGATQANPVVITAANDFTDGKTVKMAAFSGGMTELNLNYYTVANATSSTFELSGVDGTGFSAYSSAGTADELNDWNFLDDSGHSPNGFTSVTTTSQTIRANYNFTSTKVGALLLAPDETFAQKGVVAGASVNLDHALINAYMDLMGTVTNSTLLVETDEFFGDPPVAVNNGDGTITVTHASTGKVEPPIITLGSPGGTVQALTDGIPKVRTWDNTSFIYGLYAKLEGFVEYNGSAWVVTTNSFVKPVMTAFSGYLELNFGSSITFSYATVSSQGGVYVNHIFGFDTNDLRIGFADYAGAAVAPNSPNTNMKFQFSCSVDVLQVINGGYINFYRRGVILNPLNFATDSGNFWLTADMEV